MIQTIRVKTTKGKTIKHDNGYSFETIKVYRVEGISEKEAKILAEKLFCESINQIYTLNKPLASKDLKTIEIAYRPGVMNPEVASIIKAANDLGIKPTTADSSFEYAFHNKVDEKTLSKIATKLRLFNPLIENIVYQEPKTLLIKGAVGETLTVPIRKMEDAELMELSKDKLFLNLEELKVIQKYFQKIKRDPTDLELETLAQTWSEHCAHKTFKAKLIVDGKKKEPLMARLKKEALKHTKNIVSAFVDNSGVMDFYDGFAINGKAETHNSPSAIEPYGGAMTGSGGVFRDVVGTGLGAKAIASTDIFCFAKPDLNPQELPVGSLPPEYLLKRTVFAVRDYGNRVGIPTINGSFHFHNDFRAKPTVLVGSYGIIPKKYAKKGVAKVGDMAIAIGGRTGRDGIHGATFSSGEMTHRTINVNSTAVQIGNAIEERRVFDAILEARDKNCIRAIQDCGAGGFSSAFGEMGEKIGITIDLANAKVKYPGLSPWEIWVSESQERMALAIPKNKLKEFITICKKYNVETSILGTFDGSRKLNVFYNKKRVANLDMKFLHNGLPQRIMIATRNTKYSPLDEAGEIRNTKICEVPSNEMEWINILKNVLSHGNINSKEPIIRMYDHSVQGTNDLPPFTGVNFDAPNDASVLRPILNKPYGMVISHGLNPILNNFDPYTGSIWSAIEALSNYVAVGGDYKNATLINNYIWPFPDEESLWSLDKSVEAVIEIMKTFKIPVVSGKDSLSSTYRGEDGVIIKIPPTLCISVFGKIPDTSKTQTSDFKKENSTIVLLGNLDINSMAGSVYFESCHPIFDAGSHVSAIDLKTQPKIFDALYKGIQKGKILSAHDISEGGLITTLFEMCLGGNMGAQINLNVILSELSESKNLRPDYALFNETAGCFLIEVENERTAKELFKNVPFAILGKTQKKFSMEVTDKEDELFTANIEILKRVWQEPMKQFFP